MQIIIKYLIKSITEKKFRTFLIIFAVTLAGALFFASTSLTDSMVSIYTEKAKQSVGNAEVMISGKNDAPSQFLSMVPSQKVKNKTEYIIPLLNGIGLYERELNKYDNLNLTGMSLEDYNRLNKLMLMDYLENETFEGRYIIISTKTAEKYGVKVGDSLELRIGEGRRKLKIYGITQSVGLFADEGRMSTALIPFDTLSRFLGTDNKPGLIYLKTAEGVSIDELLEEVRGLYPRYEVQEPISQEQMKESIGWIAQPLFFMSLMVTFMSVFIVNSSFKVITLEKMPIIGTFRSIGASKKMMNRVLFLESICYGVLGGVSAIITGIGILYILLFFISAGDLNGAIKIRMEISFLKLVMTFVLSGVICLISSMLPILKVGKIPVKEIVLGNHTSYKKKKMKKSVWGGICIIVSFLLPPFANKDTSLILGSAALGFSLMGVIYLLPMFIKVTAKLAEVVFSTLFGNIGILAVKNIRGNKSILNSISLMTLGIGILLMITNMSVNLKDEVINFYSKTLVSDINFSMEEMDKRTIRSLLSKEEIQKVYPMYALYGTKVKEWDDKVSMIYSVADESMSEHTKYEYIGDEGEILGKINEKRYIITTTILRNRYKLEEGDVLTLEMPEGERQYTIIGFVNTMMNNGSFVMMSEKYMKLDMGAKYYSEVYVATKGKPEEVLDSLREEYNNRGFYGWSVAEMLASNEESNDQLMLVMVAFSVLAVIIGIIGIINNLLISFIERKQGIAVLRSVGMSKKQVITMMFLEAVYSGLLGGVLGIISGWLMLGKMPYILEGMRCPFPTYLVTDRLWVYMVGVVMIVIVASISPAGKSSKLNIIEAIKYE